MLSDRSFMKMRNRTGPRTDPWGTTDSTGTGSEAWPSKKNLLSAPREPRVDPLAILVYVMNLNKKYL